MPALDMPPDCRITKIRKIAGGQGSQYGKQHAKQARKRICYPYQWQHPLDAYPIALKGILIRRARREVTFHSFRDAFKTMLGLSNYRLPPNYKHEVIGHAKFALDQRHVGEIPVDETYPAVRACRYEGLALPPPPAPGRSSRASVIYSGFGAREPAFYRRRNLSEREISQSP